MVLNDLISDGAILLKVCSVVTVRISIVVSVASGRDGREYSANGYG